MDIFNHHLPWTEKRVKAIPSYIWEQLFSPVVGVTQDQSLTIINLMVLLRRKLNLNTDLSTFRKRAEVASWYNEYARSIFNIDGLEKLLKHMKAPMAKLNGFAKCSSGHEGVNLVGYSRGRLGLGEDIRAYAALLDNMGYRYSIFHIGHPTDDPASFTHPNEGEVTYNKTIFLLNAIEINHLLSIYDDFKEYFGRAVAVPPWELENLPKEWESTFSFFEEVWGISEFTSKALKKVHSKVHYAAPILKPLNRSSIESKNHSAPFRFLFIFDASSFIERKNPLAVVQAFQQAFHLSENVELVLKVSNEADSNQWASVKKKAFSDRRIKIISRLMTSNELDLLWRTTDCYVSLHRSEGFGRTLAEAIQRRLPVIATNYSGNTDLFPKDYPWLVDFELILVKENEYPCPSASRWANASIKDAAVKMRRVMKMKADSEFQHIVDTAADNLTKKFLFDNDTRPITRWLKCEKE
ncbi:glycosyltransferase [Alteromonas australica]|uniref:glycosyltransferase n=1 Tax=Alteromonas australica TaxID=589873 RepID=UPI0035C7C985